MLFHKLMKPEKFKIESETKNLQFYRNNGGYIFEEEFNVTR